MSGKHGEYLQAERCLRIFEHVRRRPGVRHPFRELGPLFECSEATLYRICLMLARVDAGVSVSDRGVTYNAPTAATSAAPEASADHG